MKRSLKILLITAGLLCAAGVLLSGTAFALGGFNLAAFSGGQKAVVKTYDLSAEEAAGLESIFLDLQEQPVEVVVSADEGIHIRYWEDERDAYAFSQENGTWSMTHHRQPEYWSWLTDGMFSGLAEISRKVMLELPASYAGELQVKTSNSSIRLEDFQQLAACSLKTTNGSIHAADVNAAAFTAETTNSSITLRHLTADSARLGSTNGSLLTEDIRLSGDLDISTSNGSFTLRDVACANMTGVTTNGSIRLESVHATGRVDVQTTNAGVRLEALSSPDIRLSSTNGSIRGTVGGDIRDYAISSHTTNGDSNLPDSAIYDDLPCRLEASTTNAPIQVEFIEE